MKKLLKALKVALIELGLMDSRESLFYERKREALRHRLHWIFFTDALEGQLDCIVRSALGNEKRRGVLSR